MHSRRLQIIILQHLIRILEWLILEDGNGFVIADIPGLIEGASEGIGLGHEFLRHIERTKMMIHVVDAAGTEGQRSGG